MSRLASGWGVGRVNESCTPRLGRSQPPWATTTTAPSAFVRPSGWLSSSRLVECTTGRGIVKVAAFVDPVTPAGGNL